MQDAAALPCASCGYDLRAQPPDGVCPECGEPVAKAIRLAAIPIRPAWADSDPRWRRRMLAGAWLLTLVPLVEVLRWSGWSDVPLFPDFYEPQFMWETLENTFFSWIYAYVAFCTGVVLLFSRERNRRRNPLDWTRRWGVLASVGVLLLGVPWFAEVTSLVLVGIASMYFTLPPANQPAVTDLFAEVGPAYLYYGPQLSYSGEFVLAAFSAAVVLLACVPIHTALRCSGTKHWAFVMLAPLALTALWQIAVAALYFAGTSLAGSTTPPPEFYFEPRVLVGYLSSLTGSTYPGRVPAVAFDREAAKWLVCLAIAVWLTVAQVRAWRRGRDATSRTDAGA